MPAPAAAAASSDFERELKALADKKQSLDKEVNQIENQIQELERGYLADTAVYGNVITGWDLNKFQQYRGDNMDGGPATGVQPRKIFSLSSVTSPASQAELEEQLQAQAQGGGGAAGGGAGGGRKQQRQQHQETGGKALPTRSSLRTRR